MLSPREELELVVAELERRKPWIQLKNDIYDSLQPKQKILHRMWNGKEFTRIGGGGARGGAKSGGGRRCMVWRRLQYPNTNGLIIRRTFPELYRSHIVELQREYPQLMQYYNVSNKELALPNGSSLFFGSAEHEKDMANFYSASFADIMADEAQEFSQHELEGLAATNRCTSNTDITPKMLYTFMPGVSESGLPPKGLGYLKRIFIDKKLSAEEQNEKWGFLQAFSWDNIEWARKEIKATGVSDEEFYSWPEDQRKEFFLTQTDYGKKLSATTNKGLRDAWLFGKWDTFQGQYFQQPLKIISLEEVRQRVKPWHKKWGSGDWGYEHPHAIYRHAQDDAGRVITYGEIWGRQVNESALGKAIAEKYASDPSLSAFPFSWDAGKLSSRSQPKFPKSIMQLVQDALPAWMPRLHPADSSPGSRIAGARLMGQLLDSGMWEIGEDCPQLIATLPTLMRDPSNPEDVLKVDYSENYIGDDAYDGARMGLQYQLGASIIPPDQMDAEEQEAWRRMQRESERAN